MKPKIRFHAPALLALSLACVSPQASADWDWVVAPYVWGASLSTDLNTGLPPPGTGSDAEFSDLIDELDGAFQIHIEGQGENWGVLSDFTFIGLAAEEGRTGFDTESDLDVRLFELAAVWSPGDESFEGFDVFAGLRRIDADFTVDFDPVDPVFPNTSFDASASYNDFLLGARYTIPMAERWKLVLRGDGSWGDTAGTWGGSAVVTYATKRGAWGFGYRVLSGDFENDDADLNLTLSGFEVGYGFRF